jgi:hypothetical protein
MVYTILNRANLEPLDDLQLHVLARAYAAAWRALRACEPTGLHVLEALDVAFVFALEREDATN